MQIIDGHCDSMLSCFKNNISFYDDHSPIHLNYKKMMEANIDLQYFALFIEEKYKPYQSLEQALRLIHYFRNELNKSRKILLVQKNKDLDFFGKSKLAVLAIEGGEPLGDSLEILEMFFELGLRSLGLTWNQRNAIANGCGDTNQGLSKFGKLLVAKMNSIGMIIDCAHIAEKGLYEVLEQSTKPVLVSHANCSALCSHPRNLSDEALRLLAQNGGIIGITFVPQFLTNNNNATIDDIIRHVMHVVNLIGVDYVAFGSDFDGCDTLPRGLTGAENYNILITLLEKNGFTKQEISKICYENHLRLLKANLPN